MQVRDSWVVRWDTVREPRPRLIRGGGPGSVGAETRGFVAFQGYLFERDQLTVSPSLSDAALVGAAYERWQQAVFDKLRGAFALAVWDEERRCLVVGRDAMGLVPCFYWWNEQVLLVSPSIDGILSQPEVGSRFNHILIAEYLLNVRAYQRIDETFYEDIRRLAPAHMLCVRESRMSLTRYWDPIPPGFAWATDDETSRFPAVLGTAVDRCLSVGADAVALSGGFDSVSVAVMAAERRGAQRPLHAVSLRFTEPTCDESGVQSQVADALGMPSVMESFDDCVGPDPFFSGLLPICEVSPNPPLSAWQPMYARLFESARERGVSGLMMGTGGDEFYYVNMGYAADCLTALDLRGLWRFFRILDKHSSQPMHKVAWFVLWHSALKSELRRTGRRLLEAGSPRVRDWVLIRRLRRRLPPWLAVDNKDLLARLERRPIEVPPVEMARGEGAYVRAMRSLPQSPSFCLELEQLHAWTGQLGIGLFFPYFDRDLVELCLRMPPAQLLSADGTKAPLRRLVARRLPETSMPRKKVIFDRAFHPLFRRHGRRAWHSLGGAQVLTDLGIVDSHAVEAMMDGYWDGMRPPTLSPWLVLSMELWLRARGSKRQGSRPQEVSDGRS